MNPELVAPELVEAINRLMDEYGPLGMIRVAEVLYAQRAVECAQAADALAREAPNV